jgi:hypothetical protein
MAIDKKTLRALRKRMPRGYLALAQERLKNRNLSDSYISQVITGVRLDKEVLNVLLEVAETHEAELKAMAQRARGRKVTA